MRDKKILNCANDVIIDAKAFDAKEFKSFRDR
jgi:hypothetical protein